MGNGQLAVVDYAVIGVFFAVMTGVGLFYSRKSKSSDQFFGNDKSVPWWLSGVSFYMNSFSALAFVMYSALAYKFGWVPVTVSWLSVPAVLLGGWFLAVRWRRAATASPIDYIAERYTPGMCGLMAWMGLPMQLLDNAFKMLAIGTVVGVGMGFPLFWSLCVSGFIIILYSFLGGFKATLMCDFIQFLVILAVVLVLPPLCLGKLASLDGGVGLLHGFRVFVDRAPEGFFSFVSGPYGWFYMIVFFFNVGASLSTNWPLIQRYYSTKSEKDARKMAYLVAVLLFLGPPLFFFPAMAARIFLPGLGESEMNGVYATLCRSVLPVGMIGMVIAAMFSATMSSLAGNFNAIASVIVNDIYLKIDRNATPGRLMLAARTSVVVVGTLVVALAFLMQYVQGCDDLFNMANKCFVFLGPIAIPMILGLFVRGITRRAGIFALTGGSAVGLILVFLSGVWPDLLEMTVMYPVTSIVTVLLLWIGSRVLPDTPDGQKGLAAFFARVSQPTERERCAVSAAVLLAVVVAFPIWEACAEEGHPRFTDKVRFVVVDPGHFHAALVFKNPYGDDVSKEVRVYAPEGAELNSYLTFLKSFNSRAENPTTWNVVVRTGDDYLERAVSENKDDARVVAVLAGRNDLKAKYALAAVRAGWNVLADKPLAITPATAVHLREAVAIARTKRLAFADIMTDRHEVLNLLQSALAHDVDLFGEQENGTVTNPGVVRESVHHFFKVVNGVPLRRPEWYYDTDRQGVGIVDVTTHMVDDIRWTLFPDVEFKASDLDVLSARRWPTRITLADYRSSTGRTDWPDFLRGKLDEDGALPCDANGEFTYRVRNVVSRIKVEWRFAAQPGGGDTEYAVMRGTKASVGIRQSAADGFDPVLFVMGVFGRPKEEVRLMLERALHRLSDRWQGLAVHPDGEGWKVAVPGKYSITHEAQFGAVAKDFLRWVRFGQPAAEYDNLMAKYDTLITAYELSER